MSATITDPTRITSQPSARAVQASVPIRAAFTQILTLAWRALVKMRRNPEQLVDVTAMPVLFTVMFGLLFGGAVSGSIAHYLPTLIPGIVAMTTITACGAAGSNSARTWTRACSTASGRCPSPALPLWPGR